MQHSSHHLKVMGFLLQIVMKKYIKSSSGDNRTYYAYPIKDLQRIIKDYLYFREDLGEGSVVTEPVFYAYIANSDMTDIDAAFVSENEAKVASLSMNSPDVALLLDGETREESGLEFDEIVEELNNRGIYVLDDESGTLSHLGQTFLSYRKIEDLIEEIISVYRTEESKEIYKHLEHDYMDNVVPDLYTGDIPTNTKNHFDNMIIPVKKEHWRF